GCVIRQTSYVNGRFIHPIAAEDLRAGRGAGGGGRSARLRVGRLHHPEGPAGGGGAADLDGAGGGGGAARRGGGGAARRGRGGGGAVRGGRGGDGAFRRGAGAAGRGDHRPDAHEANPVGGPAEPADGGRGGGREPLADARRRWPGLPVRAGPEQPDGLHDRRQ